jgi:hypothetical protein
MTTVCQRWWSSPALALVLACSWLTGAPIREAAAGYSAPCYIDGCQSADGRFVITAAISEGKHPRGPYKWNYTWKDTKTGETKTFAAAGIQGGSVYGQLFMAPDGETFAMFNACVMWWPGASADHAHENILQNREDPKWRTQEPFSKRLLIYRKDGTILKEFAVSDFVQPQEWESVMAVFNRVHWIADYPGLSYRKTPRGHYAFYQVSPDYTILEFRVVPTRADRAKGGRVVRVRLTDGHILAADEELKDPAKIPVRPFQGPPEIAEVPNFKRKNELYVPSLDPVRTAGTMREVPPAKE